MKVCKTCNLELPEENFYKNGKYLLSTCKKCLNKTRLDYQKTYRKANKEKVKIWNKAGKQKSSQDLIKRERKNRLKMESFRRNIAHNLWKRTKDRAVKKGLEFNLLEEDIVIPTMCPILEIPIFVGTKKNYKNSPTIDRVDNSKGYIKGNVKIISMLANTMKNSASRKELFKFCQNVLNYISKDDIV